MSSVNVGHLWARLVAECDAGEGKVLVSWRLKLPGLRVLGAEHGLDINLEEAFRIHFCFCTFF